MKEEEEGAIPLSNLRPGEEGEVAFIVTDRRRRLERLSSLGIVAGTVLKLVQKHPVPIVTVGHSELALDLPIARQIYVRPRGEGNERRRRLRRRRRWGWG